MTDTKIFHNPRCSKSRQTLALLEENGETPVIVEYLETPPNTEELTFIISELGVQPRDLMRKGESEYKDLNLANSKLNNAELIAVMVANPRLIERPIVIKNGKVAVGRPPENILSIL
jgi:arsenate reductase